MGRNARIEMELVTLDRIVALLLSLAGLARLAAGRSAPIRWLALWFLGQACAAAGDYVIRPDNAAGRRWSPALMMAGHDPDFRDAMNLALWLRALAHMVRNIAMRLRRLSALRLGPLDGIRRQLRQVRDILVAARDPASVGHPDTS